MFRGQNGQHLTSSDMASISWSLAMSWFILPRRSWISPVWSRTFSWYILTKEEWEYRQICDAANVSHPQLLTLPISQQRTNFTFLHSPGSIPGSTQQVLISKTLLVLFLLLGISLNPAHSFQTFLSILSAIKNAASRSNFLLSYHLLSTTYGPGIIQDSLQPLKYP